MARFLAAGAASREYPCRIVQDSRPAGNHVANLRPITQERSEIYPLEYFRAGQEFVPVLWTGLRSQGSKPRSRHTQASRWTHDLGDSRLFLYSLQYQES